MSLGTFKLARAPFEPKVEDQQAYVGAVQKKALATLSQSLSGPGTLTLLIAPAGYGKSTLIDRLLSERGEQMMWSKVRGPHTDPAEFLRAVVLGFGFDECEGNRDQLRHVLEVFLTHHWQRGGVPVVIVDDAQDLKPQVLQELLWLATLKVDGHAALNILLAGLPELVHIVRAPAMAGLASGRGRRVAVEIQALGEADTGAYIRHRLACAGAADPGRLFDESAVSLVYRYSAGIPALINTLCQSSMSCAGAARQSQVTRSSVATALGRMQRVVGPGPDTRDGPDATSAEEGQGPELGRLLATHGDERLADYRIHQERVLIGRRPDNDLQLNSLGVSRYHALLLLDPGGWLLIDLHSLNGTYVNSQRARHHRLASGDLIQIADLSIRFSHELPPEMLQDSGGVEETMAIDARTLQPAQPPGPRLVKSS